MRRIRCGALFLKQNCAPTLHFDDSLNKNSPTGIPVLCARTTAMYNHVLCIAPCWALRLGSQTLKCTKEKKIEKGSNRTTYGDQFRIKHENTEM